MRRAAVTALVLPVVLALAAAAPAATPATGRWRASIMSTPVTFSVSGRRHRTLTNFRDKGYGALCSSGAVDDAPIHIPSAAIGPRGGVDRVYRPASFERITLKGTFTGPHRFAGTLAFFIRQGKGRDTCAGTSRFVARHV